MNIEEYRDYCIAKPGVTEGFPFDEKALVFKVMDKMFALTNITLFESVNLKCDPEKAIELREEYEGINTGYHMSKKHWNTVIIDSDVSTELLISLISLDKIAAVSDKFTWGSLNDICSFICSSFLRSTSHSFIKINHSPSEKRLNSKVLEASNSKFL